MTNVLAALLLFSDGFWGSIELFFAWLGAIAVAEFTWEFFVFWAIVVAFGIFCGIKEKYWPSGLLWAAILLMLYFTGAANPFLWILNHKLLFLAYFSGYLVMGMTWIFIWWTRFIQQMRPMRHKIILDFVTNLPRMVKEQKASEARILRNDEKPEDDPGAFWKNLTDEMVTAWAKKLQETGFISSEAGTPESLLTKALDNALSHPDPNSYTFIRKHWDYGTAGKSARWERRRMAALTHFFYWPLSLLSYLLGDFLIELWDYVSKYFEKVFDSWSQKIMGGPVVKQD